MAKRMTDTDKWKKRFIRELKPKHKLLWLYILDDCNHAGIWEIDLDVASIRVGEAVGYKDLDVFGNKIIMFDNNEKCFIPDFIEFQYGELNPNSNVHKSVISLLSRYNLEGYMKGTQTPPEPIIEKTIKRFKKPTVEDVSLYCQSRNNFVDAEKFFDFYSSNGWKVGKNAMKDWKAAVRTWEKNSTTEQTKSKVEQSLDTWQEARRMING
tara:strand:- start:1304 stop:1933 length:630 start_codon:yes stop_codon:yes gene_type:complete